MGARIYLPGYGQFATTDPIFAGNTNPYTYPTDPINGSDLNGMKRTNWLTRTWHSLASTFTRGMRWESRVIRLYEVDRADGVVRR
jgi:hypothetical protein